MPVKKKPEPVTAWSFSRYGDYKLCPAKFKYKHIDRIKEPPNKAMERGTAIHKMAEDYTNGLLKRLPADLKLFSGDFKALVKQPHKSVEEQWAFTSKWSETGWFDKNCWVRIKIDAAYVNEEHNALVVIDHKTGSMRDENKADYLEQLELYALAGLVKMPTIDVVSPRLWYLDHGAIYPDPELEELEYTQKDKSRLIKLWDARTKPMMTDTTFRPKPNHKCQWCFYSKSKGGPCQY